MLTERVFAWIVHRYSLPSIGRSWPVTDALATSGDTKAGTLIGVDRYGNKFFENIEEELPREY